MFLTSHENGMFCERVGQYKVYPSVGGEKAAIQLTIRCRGGGFFCVGIGWVAKHFTLCWQREGREATYPSVGRGLVVVERDHTYCASQLSIHGLICR